MNKSTQCSHVHQHSVGRNFEVPANWLLSDIRQTRCSELGSCFSVKNYEPSYFSLPAEQFLNFGGGVYTRNSAGQRKRGPNLHLLFTGTELTHKPTDT